jgi:two-component system, OmpR family, aerobic respiration control sensor histidine kinase ArcB
MVLDVANISEEVIHQLLDSSSDILIGVSSELTVNIFNCMASQWLGVSTQKALGMPLFDLFSISRIDAPFLPELVRYGLEKKVIRSIKDNLDHNFLCHWHIIPVNVQSGSDYTIIRGSINSDYDGIANNLMQIINYVPGSLYWKDREGVYLGCNQVMLETAGLESRNDIIGKKDQDLWPENAEKICENDWHVIETGETLTLEEEVRIPGGELMYFTGVKMPLYDENNKIIGVVGNSLDITKLKKTEAELIDAKRKAEESNKIKTQFINNMEHDIRTPFNGVWGFANILADKERDPEKKEQLEAIANCAKELLNYCDGILDYSSIEHGEIPIMDKSFHIHGLLQSVVNIEMIAAKQKGLDLICDYDATLPKVLVGDSYRLKRVLLNLIGNAIKFTNYGFIKLGVFLVKEEKRSCVLKFTVEDSGIGIPEEKRSIIYERFSRGTPSNRGLYKGQGLGLRIVKQFVSELEGQIEMTSEIDIGSKFVVYAPFSLPLIEEGFDEYG